eukprot:COSAG01_NODE_5131_length_4464_cov_150.671478_1_plen_42_part_00
MWSILTTVVAVLCGDGSDGGDGGDGGVVWCGAVIIMAMAYL